VALVAAISEGAGKAKPCCLLVALNQGRKWFGGRFNGQSHATGKPRQCAALWSENAVWY
jgi:hypothetical protein